MVKGIACIGWAIWNAFFLEEKKPWPARSSHQPWSIDLRNVWPAARGEKITGCVEIRPINHIVLPLWWVSFREKAGASDVSTDEIAIQAPRMVTIRASNFNEGGRKGSRREGRKAQLIAAPLVTAPIVRIIIGKVINLSESEIA